MSLASHWLKLGLVSTGALGLVVSPALAQVNPDGLPSDPMVVSEEARPTAVDESLGVELPLDSDAWNPDAGDTVVLMDGATAAPTRQDGLDLGDGRLDAGENRGDLAVVQDAAPEDGGYRAQDLTPLRSGLAAVTTPASSPTETAETVAQVRPAQDGEAWEYVLSPYLFVPFSVRSDITVGGVTQSVSAGLGDVLSLDRIFSGALRFEARQPQYGFFADASHIFVREGRGAAGLPLPPAVSDAILAQTGVTIPPGTPVDVDITGTGRTTTVSLGGYYRVVDQVLGEGAASAAYPRLMVDPYLGVRLVALSGSLDFDVALAGLTQDARLSDSAVLFKPMLGAQVGLELSEQWALGLRGDLSGLAIGADDSFAWGLWAGARYQFSPGWALQLGYQYKDANYSLGQGITRFSIDQNQQGIWTGLDIRL